MGPSALHIAVLLARATLCSARFSQRRARKVLWCKALWRKVLRCKVLRCKAVRRKALRCGERCCGAKRGRLAHHQQQVVR